MGKKGFTFYELMIVIAIISIFMSIAFPTFSDQRGKARLKRAGRDIFSNFQIARINAMRDGRKWAIRFDTAADTYQVVHAGPDGTLYNADDVTVKSIPLSEYGKLSFGIGDDIGARPGAVTMPANGVSFSGDRVNFDPDGSSKSGTVYVKNNEHQTFAVGSITATGRIKAWAHYGQGWEG